MKKKCLARIVFVCLFGSFGFVQKVAGDGRDVALGIVAGAVGAAVMGKIILPLLFPVKPLQAEIVGEQVLFPSVDFAPGQELDFIGQDSVLIEVAEFIDAVLSFQEYKKLGAKKPKALFIEGPSGNGKTLLAHVIAKEFDCCLIPISGYFLADETLGSGEAKVRFIFDFAKRAAQDKLTILFIDDFDVFAQVSDYYRFTISKRRAVHVFAELLQSIGDEENLLVLGAANSSMELDSVLFKPGCFDRVVHIPLPTREGRATILNHYLDRIELAELGWEEGFGTELIDQTAGFSALFLKDMLQEAALIAGQDSSSCVLQEHVNKARRRVQEKQRAMQDQNREEMFVYALSEETKFSDVIGQEELLVEVKEVVDFLKNPERYSALGARAPRGLLLYGPSGCGKTLIARAVAGEAGCCFISISGSEFVKKYVGTGAMTVRLIFNFARKMAKEIPVIIFIDEIDGLGHRKTLDSSGGQTEYNNTINEILKQMDGFAQDENVIVIGATNLVDELDPALMRSGRFDRKILVPLPIKRARQAVLSYYLNKIALEPGVARIDIAMEFAKRTAGFSGASLEQLVNEAAILAVRHNEYAASRHHFEEAFDKIMLGVETKRDRSQEGLKRTAYHEAGHALVAVLTGVPVTKASILSRGKALGVTWTRSKQAEGDQCTRSELLNELMCFQGGYVAEQIIFGEVTPGVCDDLKKASEIAQSMINRFGMGVGDLECVASTAIWSDAVRQRFDEASIGLLNQTFTKTKELVKDHKNLLIKLAEQLLEKETIGEEEILAICNA